MLRTNRLLAPLGMAVLSVTLAAVPFLFNASWTDLPLGSRLTSVTSAWNQVASVFLAVYQPSNAAQLLALDYGTEDKGGSPARECSGHAEEVACLGPSDATPEPDKAIGTDALQPSTEVSWTEPSADTKLQPGKCPKAAAVVSLKPSRATVASKSASVPPINLPRIDVLKMIEQAMKSEMATRFIDKHLADYRIQPKYEFTKLVTRNSVPAAYRVPAKRDAPRCESETEPAPRPEGPAREKLRKARFAFVLESES